MRIPADPQTCTHYGADPQVCTTIALDASRYPKVSGTA